MLNQALSFRRQIACRKIWQIIWRQVAGNVNKGNFKVITEPFEKYFDNRDLEQQKIIKEFDKLIADARKYAKQAGIKKALI